MPIVHERELALLRDPHVRQALRSAWLDSNPGIIGGHEEGGFILSDSAGILSIARWPIGGVNNIDPPAHPNCTIGERQIVASFHTHPNIGDDYLQEPSETDIQAIQNDANLKGDFYAGEFVISNERIFLISPDGQVTDLFATAELFDEPRT